MSFNPPSTILASKPRLAIVAAAVAGVLLLLWTWSSPASVSSSSAHGRLSTSSAAQSYVGLTTQVADYFEAYPLPISEFGQMGKRLQVLKDCVHTLETVPLSVQEETILSANSERLATSLTPFLHSLRALRRSFVRGSKGIVIATGKKRFRFACHLISNLRKVLGSKLPIQIAYAGDGDLPEEYRKYLTSMGSDITTFDVTTLFDDSTLQLGTGGWAIKPFAILGSTFEQTILLDADTIFLQQPEVILDQHTDYRDTGTLLFHDRLLWQGAFKERHAWWEKELEHTELSSTIKHSKVFVDKFAEEGDSGVVVVDKSRLEVVIGLLHICWQNTKAVRDKYTYTMGYGDKESWWLGFELAATPYTMEEHYGAIVGHKRDSTRVCGFTIAHVDQNSKLLWYNGSLLKNKEISGLEFDVPTEWMIDGEWEKGATKQDMSCMKNAEIKQIEPQELALLKKTVAGAEEIDKDLRARIPGCVPSS